MRPADYSGMLAINGGSLIVIFAQFETGESLRQKAGGGIERIELEVTFWVRGQNQADSILRSVTALDHTAAEAIALFCYKLKKWIGAFAAALCGLDTLVFASGVGENAPSVRGRVCEGLEFLGIELNQRYSPDNAGLISPGSGRVNIWATCTDEELMIARSALRVSNLESIQEP